MLRYFQLLAVACFIATTITYISCEVLVEGPLNISRTIGETFVVIPCPFSGAYQVIWKIDNVLYEMFSLPQHYGTKFIPVSNGLLILQIPEQLEGRTIVFQCLYPDRQGRGFQASSIGNLTVTRPPSAVFNFFDNQQTLLRSFGALGQELIDLDHQQLNFQEENKTFSWKSGASVSDCNMYQMRSQEGCKDTCSTDQCELPNIEEWSSGTEATVTIRSEDLFDSEGDLARFSIIELNSSMCLNRHSEALFQLNNTVDTEDFKTSTSGNMSLEQYLSTNLVIPSVINGTLDCLCPYLFSENKEHECIIITQECGCINQTAFKNSISELKICRSIRSELDTLLITNITSAINGTKLHIYEAYRRCPSCENICQYRKYVKALEIKHVLPEPPAISITGNITTCFESQRVTGIPVDSYDITITDITGELIYQEVYNTSECKDELFGGIFHQHADICSPFTVHVKAVNNFGYSESQQEVNKDIQSGDHCSCFQARVEASLQVERGYGSLTVEVVNSSNSYLSEVNYDIRLTCNNDSNSTSCYEKDYIREQTYYFHVKDCGQTHDVELYWTPDDALSECLLYTAPRETTLCSLDNIIYPIIGSVVFLLLCITIIIMFLIIRHRRRNRLRTCVESESRSDSQTYGTYDRIENAAAHDDTKATMSCSDTEM